MSGHGHGMTSRLQGGLVVMAIVAALTALVGLAYCAISLVYWARGFGLAWAWVVGAAEVLALAFGIGFMADWDD